ncbi:Factor VIII intron 22 protein [Camelus dromedarius]|uniref:Factor VIII intron 22 protein n=1 Tax=Camelus dromedarius TaxID=9838 RepID=A0A5N4C1T0_CAMDR|nr:Factor VIII intron 22 protein [Camelus dromedarius]
MLPRTGTKWAGPEGLLSRSADQHPAQFGSRPGCLTLPQGRPPPPAPLGPPGELRRDSWAARSPPSSEPGQAASSRRQTRSPPIPYLATGRSPISTSSLAMNHPQGLARQTLSGSGTGADFFHSPRAAAGKGGVGGARGVPSRICATQPRHLAPPPPIRARRAARAQQASTGGAFQPDALGLASLLERTSWVNGTAAGPSREARISGRLGTHGGGSGWGKLQAGAAGMDCLRVTGASFGVVFNVLELDGRDGGPHHRHVYLVPLDVAICSYPRVPVHGQWDEQASLPAPLFASQAQGGGRGRGWGGGLGANGKAVTSRDLRVTGRPAHGRRLRSEAWIPAVCRRWDQLPPSHPTAPHLTRTTSHCTSRTASPDPATGRARPGRNRIPTPSMPKKKRRRSSHGHQRRGNRSSVVLREPPGRLLREGHYAQRLSSTAPVSWRPSSSNCGKGPGAGGHGATTQQEAITPELVDLAVHNSALLGGFLWDHNQFPKWSRPAVVPNMTGAPARPTGARPAHSGAAAACLVPWANHFAGEVVVENSLVEGWGGGGTRWGGVTERSVCLTGPCLGWPWAWERPTGVGRAGRRKTPPLAPSRAEPGGSLQEDSVLEVALKTMGRSVCVIVRRTMRWQNLVRNGRVDRALGANSRAGALTGRLRRDGGRATCVNKLSLATADAGRAPAPGSTTQRTIIDCIRGPQPVPARPELAVLHHTGQAGRREPPSRRGCAEGRGGSRARRGHRLPPPHVRHVASARRRSPDGEHGGVRGGWVAAAAPVRGRGGRTSARYRQGDTSEEEVPGSRNLGRELARQGMLAVRSWCQRCSTARGGAGAQRGRAPLPAPALVCPRRLREPLQDAASALGAAVALNLELASRPPPPPSASRLAAAMRDWASRPPRRPLPARRSVQLPPAARVRAASARRRASCQLLARDYKGAMAVFTRMQRLAREHAATAAAAPPRRRPPPPRPRPAQRRSSAAPPPPLACCPPGAGSADSRALPGRAVAPSRTVLVRCEVSRAASQALAEHAHTLEKYCLEAFDGHGQEVAALPEELFLLLQSWSWPPTRGHGSVKSLQCRAEHPLHLVLQESISPWAEGSDEHRSGASLSHTNVTVPVTPVSFHPLSLPPHPVKTPLPRSCSQCLGCGLRQAMSHKEPMRCGLTRQLQCKVSGESRAGGSGLGVAWVGWVRRKMRPTCIGILVQVLFREGRAVHVKACMGVRGVHFKHSSSRLWSDYVLDTSRRRNHTIQRWPFGSGCSHLA